MATAIQTFETRQVKKVINVTENIPTYTLTLTADEAETLAAIAYRTGGDPDTSPRKHVASVGAALSAAGVRQPGNRYDDVHPEELVDNTYTGGGIRFEDYPTEDEG